MVGDPRDSKISKYFGKVRGYKISENIGMDDAIKILEDFWSRDFCIGSGLPADLSLFDRPRKYSRERIDLGWRSSYGESRSDHLVR